MNYCAQAQQQFHRPPGFNGRSRAGIPVPLNREPPVGQPQLFTVGIPVYGPGQSLPVSGVFNHATLVPPVPGFVSLAEGLPVYGPGQSLPVSGPNPPPTFSVSQHQAIGGGVQPFSVSGAPPPHQAPTQPQPVTGSVPGAPANGTGGQPPRQSPGFVDYCLNGIRCCISMEDCYRLNGSCCTGGCWDDGCCAN